MFRAVTVDKDNIFKIPVFRTDQFYHVFWPEDVEWGDTYVDENNEPHIREYCELRVNICFDRAIQDMGENWEYIQVYEVDDQWTGNKYYMFAQQIQERDDLFHAVCVPYNRMNIFRFYKEYLMTFQNVEEIMGMEK